MSKPSRILCPPRPRGKIDPLTELEKYEKSGLWVAQRKFNGTRALLWVGPKGDVVMYDRYKKPFEWGLTSKLVPSILDTMNLTLGQEYWFDGEFMHAKTKGLKYTLILFDILWAGKFLFGVNQLDRLGLLYDLCGKPNTYESQGRALKVAEGVWLADLIESNFLAYYKESLSVDWCEGLVLRKNNSKLDTPCNRIDEQVKWQKRCRKPAKAYTH